MLLLWITSQGRLHYCKVHDNLQNDDEEEYR